MPHQATKCLVFFGFIYANMLIWKHYLILKQQPLSKTICQETQCSTLSPNFLVLAQMPHGQKLYALCPSVKCASATYVHCFHSTRQHAPINLDICARQILLEQDGKAKLCTTHYETKRLKKSLRQAQNFWAISIGTQINVQCVYNCAMCIVI